MSAPARCPSYECVIGREWYEARRNVPIGDGEYPPGHFWYTGDGCSYMAHSPMPRCDWDVKTPDGDTGQCGARSRFAVERSDHDPSYHVSLDRAVTEACEAHLASTIMALMDGDDTIHAAVTPRWD